ncbi:MAG: hypothetical protein IKS48_10000 [Eubacterium sp.]|nr:hypothetical protein [Eubacterium sp.]
MNYHVKKSRKTRYTYRFVGLAIVFVCVTQIVAFLMGYGHTHKIGTFFAFAFTMYGIYLFMNSFRSGAYDIDYEFKENEFIVHTKYGKKTYSYDQITDLNQIIPENELFYSIIQITVETKQFILPFSYKKEVADKIYAFLNERITTSTLIKDGKSDES